MAQIASRSIKEADNQCEFPRHAVQANDAKPLEPAPHSGNTWQCARLPCGAEVLRPVVNSPRMGVCGYNGPGA